MYHEESFLTDTLAVVAQSWVEEFRKKWGLDASAPPNGIEPEMWQFALICDRVAERIVSASKTLDRGQIDLGGVLDSLRDYLGLDVEKEPFFIHVLESHLASEVEDELYRMRVGMCQWK